MTERHPDSPCETSNDDEQDDSSPGQNSDWLPQ